MFKTMIKKISIVGLMLVFLVGCGSKSSDATVLNVTMALSEEEWDVMRTHVFPKFEKDNNVRIEGIQVESSDVVKKIQAMNAAGKMEIDVIAQDVNNLSQLVSNELVEDLSSEVAKLPKETIGTLASSGVFGDKTFFLPYRPNVEINYYNEKKFNEHNIQAPTTWEELMNVSKTLFENEGIGRAALKIKLSGDVIEIAEFIRSAGGDVLNLRSPGTQIAFEYLRDLWPYLSANTLTAGFSSTNDYLAKEEVYYAPNWPFGVNIIVRDGGKTEIKVNSGLKGPNGSVKTLGGEVLGVPIGAPNREMALKFIEYLQTQEVQSILLKENGWPSFRNDVYGDVEDWQKPYFEATVEALANAQPLPNVPYWGEVNTYINDALKEIVIDGADVAATLEKYAKLVDEVKTKHE